ncbi:hypothetical protein CHF27_008645 [Romboutsia maritimum]|uniref:Uncharacterized protein n=1 Tax=Romboutsia maritimum TaxID=2020948 RepID=A0A371ISA3_9FIRM|nr:hypothetical protein CHF27_008645 [Romboutsia maritimum]
MPQTINKDHVKGALVGVGICAAGYYLYKKNQTQVDNFLREQGISVPTANHKEYKHMSIEELMETKELVEDLIAEKEINLNSDVENNLIVE